MKLAAMACAVMFAATAFAQDAPVPKMFKAMQGKKGQYQVEILEGGGRSGPGSKLSVCTDNLMRTPVPGGKPRAESGCKHRLLKDTVDEAVIESACKERTSTVTMKRESADSVHMTISGTGPRGPREMKLRYTRLGPCREG